MKIKLNKGFTIIELLVVIAIIGILTGILLSAISRTRECGRRTQCASNLKHIGFGLIMYSNENNEQFPTGGARAMTDINTLYPDYESERKTVMCPSDNLVTDAENAKIVQGSPFNKDECSYGYDNTHTPADAAGVAIAGDRPANDNTNTPTNARSPNHGGTVNAAGTTDIAGDGQNLVYVDGHVEWVASQNAGYSDAAGNRDNVYVNDSAAGTDTYILQDGT